MFSLVSTIHCIIHLVMAFHLSLGAAGCDQGWFTFHSLFQRNMVLQAEPQISRIFGFTKDYKCPIKVSRMCRHGNVTVTETNSTSVFQAAKKPLWRIWEVAFPPESNGVMCDFEARQGEMTKTIENARYGDVWVCAGLSNMLKGLCKVKNALRERRESRRYPNIRSITFQDLLSDVERDDFDKITPWKRVFGHCPSAICYLFLKYLTDILSDRSHVFGMIVTGVGGSTMNGWVPEETFVNCPEVEDHDALIPKRTPDSHIWNAMIHPLLRFPIKGALFSIGEKDASQKRKDFACQFRSLINSWRDSWSTIPKAEFPVGFEEFRIPYWNDTYNSAISRWHQTQDMGLVPNEKLSQVFSGGTVDIVEPDHIMHPRNKQRIARRLSYAAANMVYGLTEFPVHGPFPENRVRNGSTFYVRFGQEIHHNPFDPTTGFYVCCQKRYDQCDSEDDYNWQKVRNNTVAIDHSEAEFSVDLEEQCLDDDGQFFKPVGIAYNYANIPVDKDGQGSIYSGDKFHLPAIPWKMTLE